MEGSIVKLEKKTDTGIYCVSLDVVTGSITSARRLLTSDNLLRVSSGKTGEFCALYAARRNNPAPNLLPNEATPGNCSRTKSLVSESVTRFLTAGESSGVVGMMEAPSLKFWARALRKLLFSSRTPNISCNSLAVLSNFSSSAVGYSNSSMSFGRSAGRSIMAFLTFSGRSAANCSERSSASFGARNEVAIAFARALSTSADRRTDRVAASPSFAASSTRISCNVDPSLSRSNLANSFAAAVRPTPSRSTVAVAAV
mmetsp:Transcript_1381/g.3006  ORF Transcript_1381/g.3006 Transcript_1381/m.3006 type:complete len:256 (+) Transcript_1381:62-829(+)